MIGFPLSDGAGYGRSTALDLLADAEVDARRADSWANDPRRFDDIDDKEYDND